MAKYIFLALFAATGLAPCVAKSALQQDELTTQAAGEVGTVFHHLKVNEHDIMGSGSTEPEDGPEEQAIEMKAAFALMQEEFEEKNNPHVEYSTALLAKAKDMLSKYGPKIVLDEGVMKEALVQNGGLRDSIAAHGEASFIDQSSQLLFNRARRALGKDASLLEKTTARKDATPCIHIVENAGQFPLADFDAPTGMDFEGMEMGGMYMSREHCSNNCLQACKMAIFAGAQRFMIEPHEMAAMGMSGREIQMVGGASQVGAKCDGNVCRCLDATATTQKVQMMQMSGMAIDLTKDEPFEAYPTEMICMDACHDEQGILEGMGFPVVYQGVCFDEAMSGDS